MTVEINTTDWGFNESYYFCRLFMYFNIENNAHISYFIFTTYSKKTSSLAGLEENCEFYLN